MMIYKVLEEIEIAIPSTAFQAPGFTNACGKSLQRDISIFCASFARLSCLAFISNILGDTFFAGKEVFCDAQVGLISSNESLVEHNLKFFHELSEHSGLTGIDFEPFYSEFEPMARLPYGNNYQKRVVIYSVHPEDMKEFLWEADRRLINNTIFNEEYLYHMPDFNSFLSNITYSKNVKFGRLIPYVAKLQLMMSTLDKQAVSYTIAGRRIHARHAERFWYLSNVMKQESPILSSYMANVPTLAMKLAVLIQLSMGASPKRLSPQAVKLSWNLMRKSTTTLIKCLYHELKLQESEKVKTKVLDSIRHFSKETKKGLVPYGRLSRKVGLPVTQLKQALLDLEVKGKVRSYETRATNGRLLRFFGLTEKEETDMIESSLRSPSK